MLQDAGPGDGAILGNMPREQNGNASGLGPLHEPHGALPNLAHAPRRSPQLIEVNRLDGIDDHQMGGFLVDVLQDYLQVGLGEDEEVFTAKTEAVGPKSNLLKRFLTGDIDNLSLSLSSHRRNLEHKCRFADARVATDKHQRARHDSPTQNPIELSRGESEARGSLDSDLGELLRGD